MSSSMDVAPGSVVERVSQVVCIASSARSVRNLSMLCRSGFRTSNAITAPIPIASKQTTGRKSMAQLFELLELSFGC
eukprot:Skav217382  [mRNA]  locus=scaffold4362:28174:30454:+ [translate_table: standard]